MALEVLVYGPLFLFHTISPAFSLSAAAAGLFTSVQCLWRKGFWAMCLP